MKTGCMSCVWHIHKDGEVLDGGTASSIASNAAEGYYGEDSSVLTLHPVKNPEEGS